MKIQHTGLNSKSRSMIFLYTDIACCPVCEHLVFPEISESKGLWTILFSHFTVRQLRNKEVEKLG
jgi:hypothetical protein